MANVNVYKASAGSGKTYTISLSFIKQLLCRKYAYRHILAVTFTNKATEEMKSRIVQYLSQIASGGAQDFLREIIADFKKDDQQHRDLPFHIKQWIALPEDACIRKFTECIQFSLNTILHDYGRFSIMTIDSFFQRIIRSFARETGLYAGYSLELDTSTILENAIEQMLDELEASSSLYPWLLRLAQKRIDEGKNWDFKKELLGLASELFKEDVQAIPHDVFAAITDKKRIDTYRHTLDKKIEEITSTMQLFGKKALKLIASEQLDITDFKYGKNGFAHYFQSLKEGKEFTPKKRALEACNRLENWYSNTTEQAKKASISHLYQEGLNHILCEAIGTWEQQHTDYYTAIAIRQNLDTVGILSDISAAIQDYCKTQELFLISDSNLWLRKIIDGTDTPFVYERIGSYYEHYMIDETQDTSRMQWDNFKPLILNSAAEGKDNWMVGDIKQAIYRFRNSDWRIMAERLDQDLPLYIQKKTLSYNWRSEANVIAFNNAFFSRLIPCIENDLSTFVSDGNTLNALYSDHIQNIPSSRLSTPQGYVEMRFLEENKETKWQHRALQMLTEQIIQLQSNGFRPNQIAILVRSKTEANLIVDYMLSYRAEHPDMPYLFDMLYNESLYTDDAYIVKWIMGALYYLLDPTDTINLAYIQHESEQYFDFPLASTLDKLKQWTSENQSTSVYEATEHLIETFELYRNEDQIPYLQSFQDLVLNYCRTQTVDVQSFTQWMEEHPHTSALFMPDQQNAIRLMTIHKSKGLEFEAVLLPFCAWDSFKVRNDILWVKPTTSPFDQMGMVPVKPVQMLSETIFADEYFEEKKMSYIDNLNLLYVAFTRAKKVLCMTAPQSVSTNNISTWLWAAYQNLQFPGWESLSFALESPFADQGSSIGTIPQLTSMTTADTTWPLEKLYTPTPRIDTRHVTYMKRNQDFFEGNSQTLSAARGIILHELFSSIQHIQDLPQKLNSLASEGKIDEKDRTLLSDYIHKALQNEEVSSWFDPASTAKNEAEILLPDGSVYRPDRVVLINGIVKVIDYKFGTKVSSAYTQQVYRYMMCLKQMGYPQLKGYIWYVTLNQIEPVTM